MGHRLLILFAALISACPHSLHAAPVTRPAVWLNHYRLAELARADMRPELLHTNVTAAIFFLNTLAEGAARADKWNRPEELRRFAAWARARGMAVAVEGGYFDWTATFAPADAPRPKVVANAPRGVLVPGVGEATAHEEVLKLRALVEAGGPPDFLLLDDPMRRFLLPGMDVAGTQAQGLPDPHAAGEEVVAYMRTMRKSFPSVQFVVILNFPNWGWKGAPAARRDLGRHSALNWGDAYPVLEALFAALDRAGLKLFALQADHPWSYFHTRPSDAIAATVYWPERLRALEDYARMRKTRFHLIANSEAGNVSAEAFARESLAYLDTYLAEGGRPDAFVVESWYPHPEKVGPESEPFTAAWLADRFARRLEVIAAGSLPQATPRPPPQRLDRVEPQAWVELFADLAFTAPTENQRALIDATYALQNGWLRATNEPAVTNAAAWLGRARELAQDLRATLPLITIQWRGQESRVVTTNRVVSLARGLEQALLLEVENPTTESVQLQVSAAPAARTPMAPLWIPAGGSRLFRASVLATNRQVSSLDVVLERRDHTLFVRLPLPARVEEPALLRARLRDADQPGDLPGRAWVRDAHGLLRRDRHHGTNDTLSVKPLLDLVLGAQGRTYTVPFFYSDGRFQIEVPPGRVQVALERGFEHPLVTTNLLLQPGETRDLTLGSRRFLDMKAAGWISGDTHIHWAKNWWSQDEDIHLLGLVQRAEDLRVANNLTLKHHVGSTNFIAPTQFPMGPIHGLCDGEYHAQMAEEWRNEEFYGHLILLNIKRLIEPISTGSMGGAPHFWDWPHNLHAIRETRAQSGLVIEAHGLGRNANVPVDVALRFADSLDQIEPDDYYRFLDCGFEIPLSNGSDHPARVAGCARVYVKTEAPFNYQRWIDGIRANRTFTTSGPLLFLDVNGRDIGDVLDVTPETKLRIKARAVSRHPIGVLQILSNSQMLRQRPTREREAELELEIPAGESRWIVARASQTASFNALTGPDIAHTSAIYVKVNGRSRLLPAAAHEWAARMKRHAEDLRRDGRFETPEQREEAVNYVLEGVRYYQELIRQRETEE